MGKDDVAGLVKNLQDAQIIQNLEFICLIDE